jgi:hypothetical protein
MLSVSQWMRYELPLNQLFFICMPAVYVQPFGHSIPPVIVSVSVPARLKAFGMTKSGPSVVKLVLHSIAAL